SSGAPAGLGSGGGSAVREPMVPGAGSDAPGKAAVRGAIGTGTGAGIGIGIGGADETTGAGGAVRPAGTGPCGTGRGLPPVARGCDGTRGGPGTAKCTDSSGSCSSGKWLITSWRSPVFGSMRGEGARSCFSAALEGCDDDGGSAG